MVNDPLMSKHLEKALTQFAEEGAAKLFRPRVGVNWIVGVVGELQFDVPGKPPAGRVPDPGQV